MDDQTKGFFNNILANATWDVVKVLWGPALLALAAALWEKLKNGSLDWYAIGLLFLVALVIAWLNFRGSNVTHFRQTGELQRDGTDWRTQYLEENQRRTKLQNEYADTGNKVLQLERLLSTRPEVPLNALQVDAIRLSSELLSFLRDIGPAPAPKYTAKEIDSMTSSQMKALIQANDGDFLEACEYYRQGSTAFSPTQLESQPSQLTSHMKRLSPWYQKVDAKYAIEMKGKVETMRNRFAVEGMADSTLLLPVEGKDGEKTIRAIAAKLWELAYKLSEKGISA